MDAITRHHYTNIANGNSIPHDDGSLSTVRNITIERDGLVYVLPTVWDGDIVDTDTAIRFSTKIGADWPVFSSEKEASDWYTGIKKTWEPIGNDPVKAKAILGKANKRSLIGVFE